MSEKFRWTEDRLAVLEARYVIDGPKKLAERLGTTRMAVTCKARRLGIEPKYRNAPAVEWTAAMDSKMRKIFETADRKTLEEAFGLPIYCIRDRARVLGLKNVMRIKFSVKTRTENNKSCDIHFFDKWTQDSAYIFGFFMADGSISRDMEVDITVKATDVAVLEYIKRCLRSTRRIYLVKKGTYSNGYPKNDTTTLVIASKVLTQRLKQMGMLARKSFNDFPFPEVPDEFMPHFIRGFFDGDGSSCVTAGGVCKVSFVGTPLLITGVRDRLSSFAGMTKSPVSVRQPKEAKHARVSWTAREDVQKFRNYTYPSDISFCFQRKRGVLDRWLVEHRPEKISGHRWTEEHIELMRKFYRLYGPEKMADFIGRTQGSVYRKASELGLR